MGSNPSEQYVSVELYVPKSFSLPRKQLSRRKTEKRDSVRTLSATVEGTSKKVKEKSSWLGLPSRTGGHNEPWRAATCKLAVEEGGGCIFSVFIDESKLYQTVYVHKLNHTDIRQVHHSLVDRKNCLGIHCISGHTAWSPTSSTEPLYLHFSQAAMMHAWMSLLRSYAVPEVYGRWNAASDGGLYRMWRQVKLTCMQGRNLGTTQPLPDDAADSDSKADGAAIDLNVYCEIFVNSMLCGRTTVKKCIGHPDWSETFCFTDLSPFEHLEIVVYRERKLVKPIVVGSVLIYPMNFRRSEYVEGWFPVVNSNGTHMGVQLGELRLKIRIDEEIILPSNLYAGMHRALQTRNYLDWISDFTDKLKLKDTIEHIMAIAQAHNVLVDSIIELADREVDGTHSTHNTLFRGNTVFSKAMEVFMFEHGAAFLEASLGSVIRKLCSEKVVIEIDPGRSSSRHTKSIERSVEVLVHWCGEFWTSIYEARHQCPSELRTVFAHIRQLVETRYVATEEQKKDFKDLPWQSVSSFLFLRFMVPAILHPHLFGIWPGLNEEPVRRSLTLIAKVMQSLANLNTNVQKEDFMHSVKDFLSKSSSTMMDYIMVVSSPQTDKEQTAPTRQERQAERELNRVQTVVSQKIELLRRLHREAIPPPPHQLDVSLHYASIASLVVRYSRRCNYNMRSADPADAYFDNFCQKAVEVEEVALTRVSELAKRPRHEMQQPHGGPMSPSTSPPPVPPSPTSQRERKTSLQAKRRRSRRTLRPATAPGESEGRSISPPEASVPSSPTAHSVTHMLSQSSMSSKHSGRVASSIDESLEGEPRSLPSSRPSFVHHPRSTSTDSALLGKSSFVNASTSSSVSHVVIEAHPPDNLDGSEKKRKGLFRGMLARR